VVWAALIYLGRGEIERGKSYVDEAWRLSGADGAEGVPVDVHVVVPAHIGLAAYHLAVGEYRKAIQVAERGIAIADRTGYVLWSIHRLIPICAESYLWLRDLDGAERIGKRLCADAERLGHRMGMAWADACHALVVWLRGDGAAAIDLLRGAAEELEAIPRVPDAARVRRQLAGRLADAGQRDAALRELRHVHEVFSRLGAEPELRKTREQFREIGGRPPSRPSASGAAGLTGRELESYAWCWTGNPTRPLPGFWASPPGRRAPTSRTSSGSWRLVREPSWPTTCARPVST
jgi:tetratricopeptide (TPR) repeat protein